MDGWRNLGAGGEPHHFFRAKQGKINSKYGEDGHFRVCNVWGRVKITHVVFSSLRHP